MGTPPHQTPLHRYYGAVFEATSSFFQGLQCKKDMSSAAALVGALNRIATTEVCRYRVQS
jgi:hypothetical protein